MGIIGLNLSCVQSGDFSDVESVDLTALHNFCLHLRAPFSTAITQQVS